MPATAVLRRQVVLHRHVLRRLREPAPQIRCTGDIEEENEEGRLVGLAQRGDHAAFGALVRRYQVDAVRLATVITCRADDAEDAAQTAFVKAYGSLAAFDATRPFRPWLLRIVANEAKNRRRAAGRRSRLVERINVMHIDHERSTEDEVVAGIDAQSLVRAIAMLDDRDRTVLGYRWFAQMTEAEMAVALDCAPGTVKSRLARAMQRLRTELERRPTHA